MLINTLIQVLIFSRCQYFSCSIPLITLIPQCPEDTYKQDGRQCQDSFKKDGFCSGSDCLTLQSQCRVSESPQFFFLIITLLPSLYQSLNAGFDVLKYYKFHQNVFGPTANEADDECWDGNKKGYWQGNCGYDDLDDSGRPQTYHKCDEE